ncbi:MAG: BACON domain-containing protein [Bacteroidales bacterium]|nr:BACON domain-containing protein [Bacteroidales bacterium]MBQ9653269.1 BACON domain-containing protein [Bacteroidales bacterium]
MKVRLAAYLAIAAAVISCVEPEKKDPDVAGFLVVNRQVGDFELPVSPDGANVTLTVTCDAAWTATLPKETSWIRIGEKSRGEKNIWTLSLDVLPNEGEYPRSSEITISADDYSTVVTVSQTAPDPLTLNKNPGLYGVQGGDVLLNQGRQASSFHYGERWSYRLVDPLTLTVSALGNIPENLVSGDVIPFLTFKTVTQGLSDYTETFRNVTVVRSTPTMVWLRQSESVYFIVER